MPETLEKYNKTHAQIMTDAEKYVNENRIYDPAACHLLQQAVDAYKELEVLALSERERES